MLFPNAVKGFCSQKKKKFLIVLEAGSSPACYSYTPLLCKVEVGESLGFVLNFSLAPTSLVPGWMSRNIPRVWEERGKAIEGSVSTKAFPKFG